MFIAGKSWYTSSGQHAQGSFLLLFQQGWDLGKEPQPRELRALVRHVRLNQCGQFMMGHVDVKLPGEIGPSRIGLSGPLGSDGLPLTVPQLRQAPSDVPSRLWDMLTTVPEELSEQYWRGDREDGSEAKAAAALKSWAKKNVAVLRKLHVKDRLVGSIS